jgi:hypothetical protein
MARAPKVLGACLLVLLALCACANPFRRSYTSSLERWPSGEAGRLLAPEGPAKIVTSDDMRKDALRMMEGGYLLLGRSVFRSTEVDLKLARKVSEEVGASVILVGRRYATSLTEAVPMSEWIPDREITTTETGVVQGGPNAGQIWERETTKVIEGEFRTQYVPQTTEYYDYAATYWAKSKPPIFGVLVAALDDAARQQLQSNRGVSVRAVITRSPAFQSDVLRGDIITRFADVDILDPDQFFDTVVANQGKQVTVELFRNGEKKTITAQLLSD